MKLHEIFLVDCSPGTKYNVISQKCELCGVGEYQPLSGQHFCTPCPDGYITATPGSISHADCKSIFTMIHYL